ncbi:MAG TPA: hypothetical protein VGP68_14555 [Gemmataceae bacterium]|jgi:hypothetical protein|nr:hypothetical protein [Gemmataceae bacterium]
MSIARIVQEGNIGRIGWFNYPGSVAINNGDLLYLDSSGNVQPAVQQAHGATNKADQLSFANNFIGLAGAAKLSTDAADPNFPVITDAIVDANCVSTSPNIGDIVAIANNAGNNGLLSDTVVDVTDPAIGIGRVVKAGTSVTLIRCRLVSNLLNNGPTGGRFGEIVQSVLFSAMTAATTTGTLDTTDKLPTGAIVLGWHFNCTIAFIGDTSAVIQAGLAGALTAFSAITTKSVFTTGLVGSAAVAATAENPTEASVRITITSAAAFSSVSAGLGTFKLRYWVPNLVR